MENSLHQHVTHLKLNGNFIGSEHLKVLFQKPQQWNLKVLHLSNNNLADRDIEYILLHEELKELDLSSNNALTCEGIGQLSELTGIKTLNLCTIHII